jgi:predicted nucleic-acid-binding Zn-ribbon protein
VSAQSDADTRARILQDMYNRKREGKDILVNPGDYATLLGITPELAAFNLQYLIDKGLVEGQAQGTIGTTRKFVLVSDLTAAGIEAVEGHSRQNYAINFTIIDNKGTISNTQIAGGNVGTQSQKRIESKESPGSINIMDSKGVRVNLQGMAPVKVPPYSEQEYNHIRIGKFLMTLFFKTLHHDLRTFGIGSAVSGLGFVGLLAVAFVRGLSSVVASPFYLPFIFGDALLAVLAILFYDVAYMGRLTTCPKCHFRFSFLRRQMTLKGTADLPEEVVRNHDSMYSCDNCGHTEVRKGEIVRTLKEGVE